MSYCACLLTVFASVAAVNYVIPVLPKSEIPVPRTEASANATMPIGSDTSSPYSAVLLEHERELAVILRGELALENSTFCCYRNSG